MTAVWAHRGSSGQAPENTMAAFELAAEQGAHGLECDIHLSADGQLVVIHDERLERTSNGQGLVKDWTMEELRKLDAGSWVDSKFRGERIPHLREVLELAADRGLKVNVEIKSGYVLYPGIEYRLVELVRSMDLVGQVICSSFNHFCLRELRRIAPEIEIGLLYIGALVDPWVYANHLGVEAIHPMYNTISPEVVRGCHTAGVKVHPWTVDEPDALTLLYQAGVDAVITNYPTRALQVEERARR